MSDIRDIFRANLTYYIRRSKLSQVEIARIVGVSKGSVTNWVSGVSIPDIDVINDLCQILGVSMSDMLELDIEKDAKKEQLIKNYELLNDDGQEDLLRFSEMLTSDSRKLKKGAETNHALSG